MIAVAALFVATGGCYFNLPGVDPWDAQRDARLYAGPHVVVAHPPCERWGRYAKGGPNPKARRREIGDDGGCFAAAIGRAGGAFGAPPPLTSWPSCNSGALPRPWSKPIAGDVSGRAGRREASRAATPQPRSLARQLVLRRGRDGVGAVRWNRHHAGRSEERGSPCHRDRDRGALLRGRRSSALAGSARAQRGVIVTMMLALEHPPSPPAAWREVQKAHARLVAIADGHYTRQQPGTPQFCRPGINLPLLLSDGSAGWVTWRPLPRIGRMDHLEAWECTFFRNVGKRLSSDLVREATALTWDAWGWPPRDGLITAVGIEPTARRRSRAHAPGWCFICAGWTLIGEKDGKAWLRAPHPMREAA